MLEVQIQKQCNETLRKLGILYWHDVSGTGRNRAQFQTAKPDLMFFHNAKVYAYELKSEGKKPNDAQTKMLMRLKEEGGITCGWGDSFDAFLKFLKENGVVK